MGSLSRPQWNTTSTARFTIGRDHHGWWVVQDRLGRVGGLFASEDAAQHFAAGECGHDSSKICIAPDNAEVELFDERADALVPIGQRAGA
ncbi:MAG: hypothetical protein JWM58_697 [Rhizobium sp.]|nr:hypothetical protein [Rhizobium sp.]